MSRRPQAISSERLDLIPMTVEFLKASLAGDVASTTEWLGIAPPEEWMSGSQASSWTHVRLAQLEADPALQPWLMRAVILRATGSMMGHITFHTAPAPEYLQPIAAGGIELGYTIYPAFRRQGFATEAVAALMSWAISEHGISRFVLSISPDNVPSLCIAQHFGFRKVGSHMDDVDGPEDIFVFETKDPHRVQSKS